ncbi:MAG: hypothetical protein M3305_13275 [Actinomycetota bacterium]|jgi:hypothetical protein|nr:hypothetical protein [Actinomycetota bacterium]
MAESEQRYLPDFLLGNHRAWTFNPAAFYQWLEKRVIEGGELRSDLLLELAKSVVKDASPTKWDALDWVRYDEELLENDEGLSNWWYMFALTPHLRRTPSLADRLPRGQTVLGYVLQLAGWSDDDLRLLALGRPMQLMAATYGSAPIVAEFGQGTVFSGGGWLELSEARRLLSQLEEAQDHFFSPSQETLERFDARDMAKERVSRLAESHRISEQEAEKLFPSYVAYFLQSAPEKLTNVYRDAQEMLRTALERDEALFLVIEY